MNSTPSIHPSDSMPPRPMLLALTPCCHDNANTHTMLQKPPKTMSSIITSLQDRMCPSSFKVLLRNPLPQSPQHPKDLLVVISQSRLRIRIWRRQPRNITVMLRMCQRRRALDIHIRSSGSCSSSCCRSCFACHQIPLQNQFRQVPARLRQVRRLQLIGCCGHGCRVSGGGYAGLVRLRCGSAAVVLCGHQRRCFSSRYVAQDGLDVLVPPLVGPPRWVAEGLGDVVDVELLDECLVCGLGGGDFFGRGVDGGRHCGRSMYLKYVRDILACETVVEVFYVLCPEK